MRAVLAEYGNDEVERTHLSSTAHRQFPHSSTICECLASLELATRERPDLRFIPCGEIAAKMPAVAKTSTSPFKLAMTDGAIIPDGLFGLEYQDAGKKTYRFFVLEADRGTMPVSRSSGSQTSYLGKLAMYRDAITRQLPKSQWGLPNLFVLTVMADERRLTETLRRFSEQGSNPTFPFKAFAPRALTAPVPQLLLGAGERTALPPLRIDT